MGSDFSVLPVNSVPDRRLKTRADARSIPGSTSQLAPELPRPQAALLGRETSRCVGISALLHAVLLALLSLIVIHQSGPTEPMLAEVRFEEQDGTGDKLEFLPELEAPVQETQSPVIQSAEVALTEGGVTVSSDLKMDFSRFTNSSGSSSSNVVAEAAAGIQDRVRKAGGKTGEIQFSLAWQSFNDLDLHVIAPSGEHINYRHKASRCRGVLDVDMNVEPTTDVPVENVRWLSRSAPMGRFTVLVHQYQWRSGQALDNFELLVNLGEETQIVESRVMPGNSLSVHRFQYIRASLSEARRRELSEELTRLQEREEKQASQMLERALPMSAGTARDQQMAKIILQFPHTDASLRAMQELEAEPKSSTH